MGILRLVLALSVVMSHGLTTLLGIRLFDATGAVWVFFAISGFLITIALNKKYAVGENHLGHFYWNRVIRLYPAYWVWLLLTILAYVCVPTAYLHFQGFHEDGSVQASGFWADHARAASAGTLLVATVANVTGFLSDSMLSLGFDKASGSLVANPLHDMPVWAMAFIFIGQFWSIGVELCFYVLAPFVTKSIYRIAALFLFSASGFFEKVWLALSNWADLPPALVYLRAPKFLWMFMVGAMLGHIYLRFQATGALRRVGVPVALLLAMYAYAASRGTELFPVQAFPWWLFMVLTAVLPFLFAKTSSNKLDRFAGDLSYPVYVNHFIILQIAGSIMPPNGLVFASLSILLATATVVWVERPARLLKFS